MNTQILAIDDDSDFLSILTKRFASKECHLLPANTAQQGTEAVKKLDPDLILLDVMLPDRSGVDLIKDIKAINREMPIIMVSGYGDTPLVVDAMKAGASDYIQKPVDFSNLWEKISQLLKARVTKDTEKELEGNYGNGFILGESFQIKQMVREISKVAYSDATVLLRGESGTGKNLVAEVIHSHSDRKDKPFVLVNCTAIPEGFLESDLFGHEKGAFPGAHREKVGKFELANGGTIFLDEIGDLSPELQVKILRVLQGHEFERVGGVKTIQVDVRVIASTSRDLEKALQEHKFREDLFYRLNMLPIYLPPLRERKEDIPLLVKYFFNLYSRKNNKQFDGFPGEVMDKFINYDWPGNVRELENVIERTVILTKGPQLLPSDFVIQHAPPPSRLIDETSLSSLQDIEYRTLVKALEKTSGNISKASKLLGIGRDTIYRRLKKYQIALRRANPRSSALKSGT